MYDIDVIFLYVIIASLHPGKISSYIVDKFLINRVKYAKLFQSVYY